MAVYAWRPAQRSLLVNAAYRLLQAEAILQDRWPPQAGALEAEAAARLESVSSWARRAAPPAEGEEDERFREEVRAALAGYARTKQRAEEVCAAASAGRAAELPWAPPAWLLEAFERLVQFARCAVLPPPYAPLHGECRAPRAKAAVSELRVAASRRAAAGRAAASVAAA